MSFSHSICEGRVDRLHSIQCCFIIHESYALQHLKYYRLISSLCSARGSAVFSALVAMIRFLCISTASFARPWSPSEGKYRVKSNTRLGNECIGVCVCVGGGGGGGLVSDGQQTFPVYDEVKGDSVQGTGNDIEIGERGLEDNVLLGTGQCWQLQLQHNISLLLRLEVAHTNLTTIQCVRINMTVCMVEPQL